MASTPLSQNVVPVRYIHYNWSSPCQETEPCKEGWKSNTYLNVSRLQTLQMVDVAVCDVDLCDTSSVRAIV